MQVRDWPCPPAIDIPRSRSKATTENQQVWAGTMEVLSGRKVFEADLFGLDAVLNQPGHILTDLLIWVQGRVFKGMSTLNLKSARPRCWPDSAGAQ